MVRISATALILLFGSAIVSVAAQQCGTQNGNTVCAVGLCCSQYGWLVISSYINYCLHDSHCLQ